MFSPYHFQLTKPNLKNEHYHSLQKRKLLLEYKIKNKYIMKISSEGMLLKWSHKQP